MAQKNAETIFNMEKKMAEAQMARVEMRDPHKTYNKFAVAEFKQIHAEYGLEPVC